MLGGPESRIKYIMFTVSVLPM